MLAKKVGFRTVCKSDHSLRLFACLQTLFAVLQHRRSGRTVLLRIAMLANTALTKFLVYANLENRMVNILQPFQVLDSDQAL